MALMREADNAVAPDWNLKSIAACISPSVGWNAVAPDWNLKDVDQDNSVNSDANAVAPDWNLKVVEHIPTKLEKIECSRTRLEFKDDTGYHSNGWRYNAVAPDWNLKISFNSKPTVVATMQSHQIGI